MVGEPTTFTRDWFTAFGDAVDATPLLAAARALKTEQEIERMRLANDIAAAAMEHCKLIIEPGMSEAQIAAEWEGFVHGEGTGWEGKVELALGFSLVWSGPGIKTFTATTSRPVVEGEPTLFEIWVCADGYWCDHTKNLVAGELTPRYRELEAGLHGGVRRRDRRSRGRARASPSSTDAIRAGIDALGFPGQPSHPICHGVGARAHEPPYAHQAGGGEIAAGMVLAIEPGCYIDGGGGLRVEDNFLITENGAEKLSPFPDGIVQPERLLRQSARPRPLPGRSSSKPCAANIVVVARVRVDASGLHRVPLDHRCAVLASSCDPGREERCADAGSPLRAMDVEARDRPRPLVAWVVGEAERRHVVEPDELLARGHRHPADRLALTKGEQPRHRSLHDESFHGLLVGTSADVVQRLLAETVLVVGRREPPEHAVASARPRPRAARARALEEIHEIEPSIWSHRMDFHDPSIPPRHAIVTP